MPDTATVVAPLSVKTSEHFHVFTREPFRITAGFPWMCLGYYRRFGYVTRGMRLLPKRARQAGVAAQPGLLAREDEFPAIDLDKANIDD